MCNTHTAKAIIWFSCFLISFPVMASEHAPAAAPSTQDFRVRGSTVEFTIPDVTLDPVAEWTHHHHLHTDVWISGSFAQSVPNGSELVVLPFHEDLGSVQLDQLWLSMGRDSSKSSPFGAHLNITFGKNASTLRAHHSGHHGDEHGEEDSYDEEHDDDHSDDEHAEEAVDITASAESEALALTLGQALFGEQPVDIVDIFVTYRVPVASQGVLVTLGKLPDPTGVEVVESLRNYNVSRGATFMLHPGEIQALTVSSDYKDFTFMTGVSSNVTGAIRGIVDADSHLLAGVNWKNKANVTTMVGSTWSAGADHASRKGIVDGVYLLKTGAGTNIWFNADWAFEGKGEERLDTLALASAAKVNMSRTVGLAVRGEAQVIESSTAWTPQLSGTATIDKRLDDNIILRAEGRWDGIFPQGSSARAAEESTSLDQQMTLAGELIYRF